MDSCSDAANVLLFNSTARQIDVCLEEGGWHVLNCSREGRCTDPIKECATHGETTHSAAVEIRKSSLVVKVSVTRFSNVMSNLLDVFVTGMNVLAFLPVAKHLTSSSRCSTLQRQPFCEYI